MELIKTFESKTQYKAKRQSLFQVASKLELVVGNEHCGF
jgi:hypothetical protein